MQIYQLIMFHPKSCLPQAPRFWGRDCQARTNCHRLPSSRIFFEPKISSAKNWSRETAETAIRQNAVFYYPHNQGGLWLTIPAG